MQSTFITADVFAAAMALNHDVESGAGTVNRGRTDAGQAGNQAFVRKLVSLSDYIGMDNQATTSTAAPTTTTSSSSQTPSRSDAKRLEAKLASREDLAWFAVRRRRWVVSIRKAPKDQGLPTTRTPASTP